LLEAVDVEFEDLLLGVGEVDLACEEDVEAVGEVMHTVDVLARRGLADLNPAAHLEERLVVLGEGFEVGLELEEVGDGPALLLRPGEGRAGEEGGQRLVLDDRGDALQADLLLLVELFAVAGINRLQLHPRLLLHI
jgi:hypothetical protein